MIYYDFDIQYKQQKEIFMYYKNFNTEEFLHQTQSNVLIKQIKIFKINLNLFRAFVMILYESTYDQKLNNSISKRVHHSDQKRIVIYKIFCNNTIIKKLMRLMRKDKSIFKKEFFLRMQKENDKVLFEKIIIECSVSLLRQHHIIIFKQYYLFDI